MYFWDGPPNEQLICNLIGVKVALFRMGFTQMEASQKVMRRKELRKKNLLFRVVLEQQFLKQECLV